VADVDEPSAPSTFIVRVTPDKAGRITGVVEQVRTGRKARIQSVADIGRVIAAMVASEPPAERS
jgi:hypothetical protein